MEISENPEVAEISLPLPIYTSKVIAAATAMGDEEFEIVVGLEKSSVEELKKHALDENDQELQKNTTDKKRFGENSYEGWYGKNRTIFGLIHKKTGALAAAVWFGPEPLAEKLGEWHTIAYRSYKPFRGKGLMKNFTKFAMRIYSAKHPGVRYWARIVPGNEASKAIASFLGFAVTENHSNDSNGFIIMTK